MMFSAPLKEAGPMQTLTIEVTQDHIDRLAVAALPSSPLGGKVFSYYTQEECPGWRLFSIRLRSTNRILPANSSGASTETI
jgi:hypothetical protein